jgi:hypothetical protein
VRGDDVADELGWRRCWNIFIRIAHLSAKANKGQGRWQTSYLPLLKAK